MKFNKKKIFLPLFFILSTVVFSNFVMACANPSFYDKDHLSISSPGRRLTINGTDYPGNWMDYTLYVKNNNDDAYVTVSLIPSDEIKNYIMPESVIIAPGETTALNLHTWVDGAKYYPYVHGELNVKFSCGGGQYIYPYLNVRIIGKGNNPALPPLCDPSTVYMDNGCYVYPDPGLYRSYYCDGINPAPQYKTICMQGCCQAYGGSDAFCSYDKHACIAPKLFPTPTEGNIAMICKSKNCNTKAEKNTIVLFNYLGWNVTNKTSKEWTANEIDNYDIIACSNPSACRINFNSDIYNEHFLKKKPFLEITSSNSALAALGFDYINKSVGVNKRDKILITSSDPIVGDYFGLIEPVSSSRLIYGIKDSYLTPKVEDLANLGDPATKKGVNASSFFKVNETVDHGRYAFVGFFADATVGDLSYKGEVLMNNTLKWLKYGNSYFGGTNPSFHISGDIAFVCRDDKCGSKNDISIIKWLRQNGYYVEGKSQKFWNSSSLIGYDSIVCSGSRACTFTTSSDIFNAHMNNKFGFLELPDTMASYAAYTFGYVITKRPTSKILTNISSVNTLVAPLGVVRVLDKRASIFGITFDKINSATKLANLVGYNATTMLASDASGNKGRYAYVGWVDSKFNYLSSQGKEILLKMVNWVSCGNTAGC